jgi:hypothetical protein
MEATMRKILIGEAANYIRERLWAQIVVNRRLVVEVKMSADNKFFLVVYSRLPGAPWWEIGQFTIEIGNGVAILRDKIPIRTAIDALNAAAGRQVVKARRFGALCPQCGMAHGEWVNGPVGDHCVFCGWVVGTKPAGHVEVGGHFWIPFPPKERVVVHPLTKVRVVEAHNQAAGRVPDESQRARPGELPQTPLPLQDVLKAVRGYERVLVEVVELPQEWPPVIYKKETAKSTAAGGGEGA